MKRRISGILAIFVLLFVWFFASLQETQSAPAPTLETADVAVTEFRLLTDTLSVSQPTTAIIEVENLGTSVVPGRRVYLYIDPPTHPPLSTTVATKEYVVAITWPPGDAMTLEYTNFSFSTPGTYILYAWVDPLDRLSETDESNNLKKLAVTVSSGTMVPPPPIQLFIPLLIAQKPHKAVLFLPLLFKPDPL